MRLLLYLFMVLGGIGMIIGIVKEKQGYPWARPLTVVCIVVTLLLAITTMMPDRSQQRVARQYMEQEQRYQEVVGEKIGRMLAADFAGKEVLVIAVSEAPSPYRRGLEKGVEDAVNLQVVVPDYSSFHREMMEAHGIPPEEIEEMGQMLGPESMEMLSARLMDETIAAAGGSPDAIVTLIGLPYDYTEMRLLRQRNHPPLIVVSGMGYMGMEDLTTRIARGQIAAMVMRRPDAGLELERIPRDVDEAFESRYILVTPENVREVANQYPDMFMGAF